MKARMIVFLCLVGALAQNRLSGATKLLVTVVEQKTGRPVTNLKAPDFSVLDQRSPRDVAAAEFTRGPVDVMLLLDTSLVGAAVQPVAANLISQLQEKDLMAVVAFHSSADLIQDFTSSRDQLMRAVGSVKYGNMPRVLDAIYAATEGGFQNATFRRVVLLLTMGMEGGSRVSEREVVRLARRNGVSVFPVYMAGPEKSMFESLARQTGGASFNLKEMKKTDSTQLGPTIFEALRGHYVLTLADNFALGDQIKVEAKTPGKAFVSAMPLD